MINKVCCFAEKKNTHRNRKKKEKFPFNALVTYTKAALHSPFYKSCVYKDITKCLTSFLGIVQPQRFGQVSGNRLQLVIWNYRNKYWKHFWNLILLLVSSPAFFAILSGLMLLKFICFLVAQINSYSAWRLVRSVHRNVDLKLFLQDNTIYQKSENVNSMTITVLTSIWHSGWGSKQWMHSRILHRHSLFSCCFRCLLWTILSQFLLVHVTWWKGQDPKWACSTKKKHNREFHLKLIGLQKSTLPWLGVLTTVSSCLLFIMSE